MKIQYDKEADGVYIQFSSKRPEGAIETKEGFIVHTTSDNEIVGIEILDASKKFPIRNLRTLEFTVVN